MLKDNYTCENAVEALRLIDEINIHDVAKIYNGQARACCCGCKGTITEVTGENLSRVKAAMTRMRRMIREGQTAETTFFDKPFCGEKHFAVSNDSRITIIYWKAGE